MSGNGPKVDITTTIDSSGSLKQINEAVSTIKKTVDMTGGAFASYEKKLSSLLKQLEKITRQGSNSGQTVRDLSLVGGGTNIGGRVKQSLANNRKSEMRQVEEVLVADMLNFQRQVYGSVAKSVKSALVAQLARSKQAMASVDAEIRAAQIEAQRARVGFAAQLNGSRGNVRGTITENANALGIQGLGTLRAEQAALDKLLAAEAQYATQIKTANRELRTQENLQNRIRDAQNSKLAPLQRQIEMMQKANAIEQQNLRIANAAARGDRSGEIKARLKQESLRLDQLAMRGVKEESAEFKQQINIIRDLVAQEERLVALKQKGTQETREQMQLERSRQFAAGKGGTQQEIMMNNMTGARKAAGSVEGRASLLALQGNLLMNYGLLGGGVAAIGGMTSAVVQLDAKLRELQAIAGATNGEFNSLRGVILKTSEDTKFSAVELAESATMLAQVGQSAAEIENTLPVISAFAMAVGTDMKNAVDIVTTSLTVFNMNASQTQRVTNVLTEALNRSKLSMDQLVLGFQYAANIAADSGVTFEELTAVLAGMSQAGIRSGSMLGTGLRQILISLAAPTEEVLALMSELGLTMNDVDVRTQGLTGVLENLAEAGITASQAMGAFETRTAAALVAATNQVSFIRSVQEQFIFTRAAEEAAAKQSESFKNSMLELKNELLSFINDAARPVLGLLIDMAKGIKAAGNSIGPLIPLLKAMGTAIITVAGVTAVGGVIQLAGGFLKFSGVAGALTGIIPKLTTAWTAMNLAMTATGTLGARLSVVMTGLSAVLPGLLIIGTIAAALVYMAASQDKAANSASEFAERIDDQRTKMNTAQATLDKYKQVISQIDQTIARARDRANQLKDGSEQLRIEVMNGAAAFNEYGAGIDATNTRLEDYIAKLQQARNGVTALAEAQAAETYKEAQKVANTERGEFGQRLNNVKDDLRSDVYGRTFRDLTLAPKDRKLLEDSLNILRNMDPNTTDAGSLANIANASSNASRILSNFSKTRVLSGELQQLGFSAGSYNAALSNERVTGVTSRGIALTQAPEFQNVVRGFDQLVNGFEGLEQELGVIADQLRDRKITVGEASIRSQAVVGRYGSRYRAATTAMDQHRENFLAGNPDEDERYAFNDLAEQTNDRIVSLREVLLKQQQQIDKMITAAIDAIEPMLNDGSGIAMDEIRNRATGMGLNIPSNVRSRSELTSWIEKQRLNISTGNSTASLLGNVSPMNRLVYEAQTRTVDARAREPNIAEQIREQAKTYKLDPETMVRIARIESRFNPNAKNPESTATGIYQFMADTWNNLHPDMKVSTRIADNDPNDPRKNANLNIETAMQEMSRIVRELTRVLGRAPEGWEMYMAWQQGEGGTKALMRADPNANAISALTPAYRTDSRGTAASKARAAILGNGGSADMTAGGFLDLWKGKYAESAQSGAGDTPVSAAQALEDAAKAARRQMEAIADGARTVANTAKNLVTRTLRNLGENTSDTEAQTAIESVTTSLKEVEDQTNRYYRLRIEALNKFRDTMFNSGQMTNEQRDQIGTEIADLQDAWKNEVDRIQEDTIGSLTDLFTKLPQSLGSIAATARRITEALTSLQNELDASPEAREVALQTARESIGSQIDGRNVAYGNMSQAEADAHSALRGRDARGAAGEYQGRRLASATIQRATASAGLDQSLGNTGLTLRGVDLTRVIAEREKLNSMSKTDTVEYAKQKALVQELTANLETANSLRTQERDLTIEIEATTEAIALNSADFGDRLRTIVTGWAESRGTFNSMITDVLNGVPGVLDAVSSSFSTFFSDVLSGTASVSDAFRSMAGSILKSMMDIVASAAAKQLMRMLVNIGMSLFSGGTAPTTAGPDVSTLASFLNRREGGMIPIRAATGTAIRGRDNVLVNAMPGEYMLRKSAVDAIGVDNLDYINSQGNRMVSGAAAASPVSLAPSQAQQEPMNIYVVSPDKVPPTSKKDIVIAVQDDMINKGPIYKTVKAAQAGAI